MIDPNKLPAGSHYAVHDAPPRANTDHIRRKFLDLAYASGSPAQKLDIYLPDQGGGPFPVIVSIHGGAFMGCDKTDIQVMPMLEGLKRGYAVVAVNYRLSGESRFPALVHDVKAAVRWIRANAGRYSLHPGKIAAWGGSAGGYLSSMLGVSADVWELEDLSMGNPDQPSAVQAVVDWFGPTNFLKMDEQLSACGLAPQADQRHNGANSPESMLLGGKITEIPEKVRVANPETYIRQGTPPFFIQHGTQDAIVPVQQSIEFAVKLRQVMGADKVQLELIEAAAHADPMFESPQNVSSILDFLDQCLKSP